MAQNGQLPSSDLAIIAGGGRLRKDAAAAWNAMSAYAHDALHKAIKANDAYRMLGRQGDNARGVWSQWAAWERWGASRAARPGTSNHGWGLAVDADETTQAVIGRVGKMFGFSKSWSDAANEDWHICYQPGHWPPHFHDKVGPGAHGEPTIWIQLRLRRHGFNAVTIDGAFGPKTENAVKAFKRQHRIASTNGWVGRPEWQLLAK